MYVKMDHKFLENWISYVAGIFGFGVGWINAHLADIFPKIFIAVATAFVAGYIGHVGKLFAVWSIHKVKILFSKFKKKQE